MSTNKMFCVALTLSASLAVLSGCSLAELRQEFFGLDKRDVLNSEPESQYKNLFKVDKDILFDRIVDTLKGMNASIYGKDKRNYFILAMRFDRSFKKCIDTTQVGIVINTTDNGLSEVIVHSGNYSLARYVANKLFSQIDPFHVENKYPEGGQECLE